MIMKRILTGVALVGVLATAAASGPQLLAASAENEERGLKGSWEIKITQPESFAAPIGPLFPHSPYRDVRKRGRRVRVSPGSDLVPTSLTLSAIPDTAHGKTPAGRASTKRLSKDLQIDQAGIPFVLHSTGTVTEQITVSPRRRFLYEPFRHANPPPGRHPNLHKSRRHDRDADQVDSVVRAAAS